MVQMSINYRLFNQHINLPALGDGRRTTMLRQNINKKRHLIFLFQLQLLIKMELKRTTTYLVADHNYYSFDVWLPLNYMIIGSLSQVTNQSLNVKNNNKLYLK